MFVYPYVVSGVLLTEPLGISLKTDNTEKSYPEHPNGNNGRVTSTTMSKTGVVLLSFIIIA